MRTINAPYFEDWQFILDSGLLADASAKGWLPAFNEVSPPVPEAATGIEVKKIPFISYPYEWCFSQLKDAAKLTLDLQLAAQRQEPRQIDRLLNVEAEFQEVGQKP